MPLPAEYNTGTVTGTYLTIDGAAAQGTVTFTPRVNRILAATSEKIILPRTITVTLVDGSFSVALPATNDPDISPANFTYRVVETITGGGGSTFDISVLAGTTLDLSTVLSGSVSSGGSTIIKGDKGDPGEVTEVVMDAAILDAINSLPEDGSAVTASLRTLGPAATQAAAGDTVWATQKANGLALRQKNLDDWFTAYAASKATPCDVVIIGDSIMEVGSAENRPPAWRIGDMIGRGSGLPANTQQMMYPGLDDGYTFADTLTGSVNTSTTAGYGTTLAAAQQCIKTAVCAYVEVWYRTSVGAGSLLVYVDSVLVHTINTDAAAGLAKWTSSDLTLGSHEIKIVGSGANAVLDHMYFHTGAPTTGAHVRPIVHSGWTSADYHGANASRGINLIDALDTAGTLKLVIIATGTNDDPGYAADLTALVAAVEAVTSCTIAIWIPPKNGALSQVEVDAGRVWALASGHAVIDMDKLLPDYQSMTLDSVHPTTIGQDSLAVMTYLSICGDPIGEIARLRKFLTAEGILVGGFNTDMILRDGDIKFGKYLRSPDTVLTSPASGRLAIPDAVTPSDDDDIATKAYADTKVSEVSGASSGTHTHSPGTAGNEIIQREALGQPQIVIKHASVEVLQVGTFFTLPLINFAAIDASTSASIRLTSGNMLAITSGIELTEMSEPAAPDSNGARIFTKDNGSGKTQLCVKFSSGAVQVIATQP